MMAVWESLARDFDEFVVFARSYTNRPAFSTCGRVRFILLPSLGRRQLSFLLSSWLFVLYAVLKRPAVVVVQSPLHGGLPANMGSRLAGSRFVVECHGDHYMKWRHSGRWDFRALAFIVGFVLRNADRVRAVNPMQATQLVEGYRVDARRIRVVPYRVDTDVFFPTEGDVDEQQAHRLLMACSIVARKRVSVMLEVLNRLPATFSAVVAGTGILEDEMLALAQRLGLQSRVRFIGQVDHARLAAEMRVSGIYLLLSDSEAMPRAILEAMASGMVIVTTDVGVISDVVSEGVTGRFVPIDDIEATAAAVVSIATDPCLYRSMRQNALDLACSMYGWDSMMSKYRTLLSDPC